MRKMLLRERPELNCRIEKCRQEMVMDQNPEGEDGVALRNSSTGMAIATIEREVRTLAEIDLSLRRIESGDYGICRVCGDKIPLARLMRSPRL